MRYDVEIVMCAEIDVTLHHLLYIYYTWYEVTSKTAHMNFNLELSNQYSIIIHLKLKMNKKIKLIF